MARASPETRLYQAVIKQAAMDAISHDVSERNGSGTKSVERNAARAWLTRYSKDFVRVCHYAGFDPQAVRAAALKLQRAGWK